MLCFPHLVEAQQTNFVWDAAHLVQTLRVNRLHQTCPPHRRVITVKHRLISAPSLFLPRADPGGIRASVPTPHRDGSWGTLSPNPDIDLGDRWVGCVLGTEPRLCLPHGQIFGDPRPQSRLHPAVGPDRPRPLLNSIHIQGRMGVLQVLHTQWLSGPPIRLVHLCPPLDQAMNPLLA